MMSCRKPSILPLIVASKTFMMPQAKTNLGESSFAGYKSIYTLNV